MEAVALVGGILLVLALGGGIKLDSKLARIDSPVPQGDRAYAALLGGILIALTAIVEADATDLALWIDMAAGAIVILAYARFIWRSR